MISLQNILTKITEIGEKIRYEYHEINDIISIEIYSDESGSIHSDVYEYFSFEKLKDLKHFLKLDNDYIIQYRKKYPL